MQEKSFTYSQKLYDKACKSIPGGVNSPVRAFKAVGGNPPFIREASGAYVRDVDDNVYIDYVGSWGPMILGHAQIDVLRALGETARKGLSFGMCSPKEIALAEEVKSRVPSVEMIRFVNSGSEAAMSAIRLARAVTEREKIIKFAGCYHGHADSFLVAAGSGAITFGVPDSPGVTKGSSNDTLIADFNDIESVKKLVTENKNEIATVIIEPVAGNMGVIPSDKAFLSMLRELCDENGIILIFDEVMSGFRVAPGGAQEMYDIKPDLTLFGKIIGGGLPVGAFGGRADIMNRLAPHGDVYQAGTLSGNPLAMAAGLATLQHLKQTAYDHLDQITAKLALGLREILHSKDIPGCVQSVGSMLTIFFDGEHIKNFNDVQACDHKKFADFFRGMFNGSIFLPPSGYESWFVSTAHSDVEIEKTLEVAEEVM